LRQVQDHLHAAGLDRRCRGRDPDGLGYRQERRQLVNISRRLGCRRRRKAAPASRHAFFMRDQDSKAPSFQVPLMLAFREAFREGDASKRIEERLAGERVVSARGSLKRRGADEVLLRRDLATDLLSLVNTIDLSSAEDISELEYV